MRVPIKPEEFPQYFKHDAGHTFVYGHQDVERAKREGHAFDIIPPHIPQLN